MLTNTEKLLAVKCCGHRLFVGDIVIVSDTEYYVSAVDLKLKRITLIRLGHNEIHMAINIEDKDVYVYRTDKRIEIPDYELLFLKKIYKSLSDSAKVFYLYHYYRCNKDKIKSICRKLKISKTEFKIIMEGYKEKGYLENKLLSLKKRGVLI